MNTFSNVNLVQWDLQRWEFRLAFVYGPTSFHYPMLTQRSSPDCNVFESSNRHMYPYHPMKATSYVSLVSCSTPERTQLSTFCQTRRLRCAWKKQLILPWSLWYFPEKNYAVMTLSAAAFTRGNCWLFILLVSFMNGNSVRPLKVYLVCEEDPEIINNRLVTKKTSLSPSNVPFSSGCFSENWPPHIWSSYVFKIISRHSSHLVRISRGRSISKTFH